MVKGSSTTSPAPWATVAGVDAVRSAVHRHPYCDFEESRPETKQPAGLGRAARPARGRERSTFGDLILPQPRMPCKLKTRVFRSGGAMPGVSHPFASGSEPVGGAMFADEIRRAIEAAPRMKLPEVAALLWRAFGADQITEVEAEELSARIDVRRALPAPAPTKNAGTRPRSPASIERRRKWSASGNLPVGLAARFSQAEQAVLAVVATEVTKYGRCTLFIGHIAALAGVGETTVRNALREAKHLGLVAIEIRRVTAWRNEANVVTIISAEWSMWLSRGGRMGGFKSAKGTVSRSTSLNSGRAEHSSKRYGMVGDDQRSCRGVASAAEGSPIRHRQKRERRPYKPFGYSPPAGDEISADRRHGPSGWI